MDSMMGGLFDDPFSNVRFWPPFVDTLQPYAIRRTTGRDLVAFRINVRHCV
jgi:hypothetical protein